MARTPALIRPRQHSEDYCMPASIRLNKRHFLNWCRLAIPYAGKDPTNEDIATFIGVHPTTVGRVLRGERAVGADFIAAALDAFQRRGMQTGDVFDHLFDVEADAPESERSGT